MSRFKIIGNHEVDGVEPGGSLTIADKARARALVRAGHLEPIAEKKKASAKKASAKVEAADAPQDEV